MQQIWRKAVKQHNESLDQVGSSASSACSSLTVLASGDPALSHAQIAGTANIQGTVTDSTGAVVADASIALTDEATQVKRTTVSDGSGVYLFPCVPIGTYDLTSHRDRIQDLRAERHRA